MAKAICLLCALGLAGAGRAETPVGRLGSQSVIGVLGEMDSRDVLGETGCVASERCPYQEQLGFPLPKQPPFWPRDTVSASFQLDTDMVYVPPEFVQGLPELTFGSSSYLVVWADNRTGDYDVCGTRVTPAGQVLDTIGISISAAASRDEMDVSIGFDGTNYLVVWADKRGGDNTYFDIYGARVSQDGVVIDPEGFPISIAANYQILTAVSFNGTNYLVAWADYRNGNYDIYGARVTPDGAVLDDAAIAIYTGALNQAYASVASDGADWLVAWGAAYDSYIRGARVSSDGTVLDPGGIVISTGANDRCFPDVSFDGANYLVVWQDRRSGTSVDHWSVYGARVTSAGAVLDPSGIPIAADDSRYEGVPELKFDATNYLVVWKDDWYAEMTGARVAPDGTVLDPGGFPISGASGHELFHAVGFDGANWLVVWEDFRGNWSADPGKGADMVGARVDPSGAVLDPYPTDIAVSLSANWQYCPRGAFDGTNYLVVWQDKRSATNWDIHGTRVSPDGTILDIPALSICSADDSQATPAVAFGSASYLVVWEDYRTDPVRDIYGARIGLDGSVLDPSGFAIATANVNYYPAVAFDGTNYMVVWWQYTGSYQYHVYGARVSQDGSVLDPGGFDIALVTWDYGWNYYVDISIAFDGTNYVVVWPDFRNGTWDIYGARVAPAGTVLDPGGFPISAAAGNQYYPEVTSGGGYCFALWQDTRGGGLDVYGARLDASGTVLDPSGIAVSTAVGSQTLPLTAFDGTNYVVVWADTRNGDSDIYGARVEQDGTVLDPDGFPVSTADHRQGYPCICAGPPAKALIVYAGYAEYPYRATRSWGVLYSHCPGDLDGDGDTDHSDLGILLADWGCVGSEPEDCPGDLDGDFDTDHSDLGILLADWGCGT